ncbi:uncharacterized protein ACA1_307780 [Acanthamoeba castellanii str. Neff]|uniref:Chromo domain-containing protein n=1 Tax=Acanthamoeba castellanii (strain ATCC 30010 / Neff) TaxID=1257118 RepID=L8HDZ2_ACACF|nr:uncharacterized protein ACA1_307780 [Acanthamoeba castellanii str. Neff]ELR22581.1 hypothetical protein ACA1_307780 [Acanthamoeba castellanii str. Neff]
MDLFLKVRAPAEIAQLAVKSKQLRGQEALVMQRVLMGLMLYLGGGLRKQVFVNLYVGHLQWDEDEMVMQLFTYIEFFKQRLKILIKDFNPELTTTAIDFRCMTITNLFAEHVPLEEGETIEHLHNRFSDYLGVSVKIMKTVYNRHDLKKKHKGTLNAANAGKVPEGAQTAMGKMEAKMATAIVEEEKHQHIDLKKRQARTTEDDEEWQSVSGHLPKKRKRRVAYEDEEEEEEEEELEAEEDSQEEDEGEDEEEEEEEDEVESIQEMRIAQSGELELCVRWVGYSEEFDMWLPLTQLGNALACVEEFIKANFL